MGLNKRLYVEYDTKINAENMNEIQDCIIANERKIQEIIDKTVGIYDTLGLNNELFNDVLSHVIDGDDSTKNNHLEGSGNKIIKAHKNYNNEGNHLEGYGHVGGGYCGHCENSSNQTYETNAHAGGTRSIASGAGTFSQGRGVISMGLSSAALGQSLFTDGSTTVLGIDGEETEIDWTTHPDETEQQRSKRIADRIEKLYLGTELKADGTPNTSVQRKFLASLGTGTIVGGVNSFGRGTANLVHGLGCYTLSSYCFSGGYSAKIGKNSDDCFAFGDNLIIENNVKDSVLFGTLNTLKAPYSFMAGYQNSNGTLAQYSFLLATNSYINAPNSYGFGDHLSIGTKGQFVFGKYNDNTSTALFAIANGTESKRKNIFEIYSDKNVFQNKNVFYDEVAFGKTLKSINCGNNAYNTIVMGLNCSNNDTADNSFTGGQNCQSQAKNAFTFGLNSYAAAENSAAFGQGTVVGTAGQFAVGKYNDNNSKAIFAVGSGTASARKNAFEVFDDSIAAGSSQFKSLKLIKQVVGADGNYTFTFDNSGTKLNFKDSDNNKYNQGSRPYCLIANNDDIYYTMMVTSVNEFDSEITIVVAKDQAVNLAALVNVTPDANHYIIIKNNIGVPFGNYIIKSNDRVFNTGLDCYSYGDGSITSGVGSAAVAPFGVALGEGNYVAVRRGAAVSGENNFVFNWASTSFGAYNRIYGGASNAFGQNASILAYGGMNFGFGNGYYNPRKEDGTFKTAAEIKAEADTLDSSKIAPNVNVGMHSTIFGSKNIAGGLFSIVGGAKNYSDDKAAYSLTFGNNNTNEGSHSLVLGDSNINKISGAIVNGNGLNNDGITENNMLYLGDKNNNFKVTVNGWVQPSGYYIGKGGHITTDISTTDSVSASPNVELEDLTFKELTNTDYTNGNLSTNTENNAGKAEYGLLGAIDYSNKNTFWHSKFKVVDGNPVPNPKLTDNNPYTISLKVDSAMTKNFKGQLVIRFYPRENQDASTGTWSVNPGNYPTDVQIKIGNQTATFNGLTVKDYSSIDEEANNSFYHDFVVPFDGSLTENSEIVFEILKVPNTSEEYPNGKFACAQGIRFGYSTYEIVTKPDINTNTLHNTAKKVSEINDGAYYSTEQLLRLIKSNTSSVPGNILTTDKANVANGYAALDANRKISVAGMEIPCNTYPSNEAGTTNYLSNGIQCYDSNGFSIQAPYYGWYIKFTPGLPGEIITNYSDITIKNGGNKSFRLYNIDSAFSQFYDDEDTEDDATLWVNKYGSDNKWSVVRKVVNIDETKQNKPVIMPELSGTTVTLAANTEYHHINEDSATLTFKLPTVIEEEYQSYISFKSGATATTITVSTFSGTLKFKGDDCANGVFTPTANRVYEVSLKCIGTDDNKPYIVAKVDAY